MEDRKWIYMPTTSYPRAFMCLLLCVSVHRRQACSFELENKEALILTVKSVVAFRPIKTDN